MHPVVHALVPLESPEFGGQTVALWADGFKIVLGFVHDVFLR